MKQIKQRFWALTLSVAMLFSVWVPTTASAAAPVEDLDGMHVQVMATSDVHGAILATDYSTHGTTSGGLTRVATKVKALREANPNSLLIDVGDTIQGTPLTYYHAFEVPEEVDPAIKALRLMGYDAWVLGNHEFNYGLDILTRQMDQAKAPSSGDESHVPVLAANFVQEGTEWEPWEGNEAYIVKEFEDTETGTTVKVGVLGVDTPNIPQWEKAENYEGIDFRNFVPTYEHYIDIMKEEEGCDVIVVAAHAGVESEHSEDGAHPENSENQVRALIENTTGIDLVFSGHLHISNANATVTNKEGKEIPVVSPGTKANGLAYVDLVVNPDAAEGEKVTVPCMLQFLQYKVFGQHRVPAGWIVVTAGNPPEYNKSVRDFDIVTWDRLKRIDVEPDYEVWKAYAEKKGVHPAVTTYLAARRKDFYKVESAADGKRFVTARGWDDLSEMMRLCEENGLAVNEKLIGQYLQEPKIAKDFAIYYDLFNKYRGDYQVGAILAGAADEAVLFRARQARLDERLSLIGLLFDALTAELRGVCDSEDALDSLTAELKKLCGLLAEEEGAPADTLDRQIAGLRAELEKGRRASSLPAAKQRTLLRVIAALEEYRASVIKSGAADGRAAFALVSESFAKSVARLKESASAAGAALDNVFDFCGKAFGEGDEMLIFVTELTAGYYSARFIGHYGCEKYYLHNRELRFQERDRELRDRAGKLDWTI